MGQYRIEAKRIFTTILNVEAESEGKAIEKARKMVTDGWYTWPKATYEFNKVGERNILDEQIANKLRELKFLENEGIFWRVNDDRSKGVIYDSNIRFMHCTNDKKGWILEDYPDLIQTLIEYGIKIGVR